MTRREARKAAYNFAAGAVQDAAEAWNLPYDDEGDDEKVRAAMADISDMLFRRAGPRSPESPPRRAQGV